MTNSEIPNNSEELKKILRNATTEELSKNLSDLISSYKQTNIIKNKKLLKLIFEYVIDYLMNKLNPKDAYKYLNIMFPNFLELSHLFPSELNEFIKKYLVDLEAYILQKKFEEDVTKENQIINFSLLICYLTHNLNQPNQLFSNYFTLLNIYFINIKADFDENFAKFSKKIFYIGILEILSQNVNSFDPVLFNGIEYVLHLILNFFKNNSLSHVTDCDRNSTDDIEPLSFLNDSIGLEENIKNKIILSMYSKLTQIILSLINYNKENLSFDVLFKKIVDDVKEIEKFVEQYPNLKENSILIRNKIEENKFRILQKKNIQLNFMIIKKKPLVSLEPEYDRSFLGNLADYKPNNEKMTRVMKKKIKSTKKQAVRNLKKEAKVIDVARQKRNKVIYEKRKEELKISNQFIEQQKIEDKKLMTSQSKKRFKLKKK